MELNELLTDIHELRTNHVEKIAESVHKLWKTTGDSHVQDATYYLYYELIAIASKLADLEETEEQETDISGDTERIVEADTISDWWTDLELRDKCEIANIPYPTSTDGRGEELLETEERADRWWNSRTYEQKEEIYEENLAWWDKE